MSFDIQLKDESFQFNDIIELNETQKQLIHNISSTKTYLEWQEEKTGIKVPLLESQKKTIFEQKNAIVSNKDESAIEKDGTIVFSKHARERIAVRVDKLNAGAPPTRDSLLLIIVLVMQSELVDNNGEWKGFTNLSYTLIHRHLNEEFKITVSFEIINGNHLKVITISNDHIDKLSIKLIQNPEIIEKLNELRKRLAQ